MFIQTSKNSRFFTGAAGDLVRSSDCATVRPVYSYHFARIANGAELRATLRAGAFAWPGGYPLYLVTLDGAALCFDCARANLREITEEIRGNYSTGWRVVGCETNEENTELTCDHCGARIPSAYGDDENEVTE